MGTATKESTPQTGDSKGAAAKDNTFAVFAVFTSLSLAILSLFWEWGSSTGHQPLSSDPEIWLAVMPLCVVLAAGYLMVWFRTMSSTVFNLCVLVAAGWVAYLLADVVNTIQHHATLGLGAKLALGSLVAACLAAASLRRPSIVVTPRGSIWGACCLLCAVTWVVGVWGPWIQTVAHIGVSGPTWRTTHTADFVQNCCYAFSRASPLPEKLGIGLTMAIIVVGSILFALSLPGWVSGSSVIALGVLYARRIAFLDLPHRAQSPEPGHVRGSHRGAGRERSHHGDCDGRGLRVDRARRGRRADRARLRSSAFLVCPDLECPRPRHSRAREAACLVVLGMACPSHKV